MISRLGIVVVVFSFVNSYSFESKAQAIDFKQILGAAEELLKLEQSRKTQNGNPPAAARPAAPNELDSSPERPLNRGEIREVQAALNAFGYDAGPVDGISGRRTRAALKAWQRDNGLLVNGELKLGTLLALRSATEVSQVLDETNVPKNFGGTPSFNCAKASTLDERAICASPALAERDRMLADTYNAAIATATTQKRVEIVKEQRAWLSARRSCGGNENCLAVMMDERIAEFSAYQPLAGSVTGGIPRNTFPGDGTGRTRTTSTNNPLAAPVAPTMPSGIRSMAPIMSGNRLLTGYTVMFGKFNKESVDVNGRRIPKSSFDLAMFIDLMMIRQSPEILKDQYVAYDIARRYLSGPTKERYIAGCKYGSCNRNRAYDGWKGSNEFEREETFRAFVSEIGPQLAAAGTVSPVDILRINEVEILAYDDKRQAFPLRQARLLEGLLGTEQTVLKMSLQQVAEQPTELSMSRDQAKAFVAQFTGKRIAYLGFYQTLSAEKGEFDLGISMKLIQTAVSLYADPLAQKLLYDFSTAGMAESSATGTGGAFPRTLQVKTKSGIVWIGDRVAVIDPYAGKIDPLPPVNNLENALLAVIGKEIDFSKLEANAAVGTFFHRFDLEDKKEILSAAAQRPLNDFDIRRLKTGGTVAPELQDPFGQRRAAVVIREKLSAKYAREMLAEPVPVRVYCTANVEPYDFSKSSFPISLNCGRKGGPALMAVVNQANRALNFTVSQMPLPDPVGGYPSALPMDPERAEEFQKEAWQGVLVSYETEMSVTTRTTEAGLLVTTSFSAPVNFVAHEGRSGIQIAFPLGSAQMEPAETAGLNNNWDPSNRAHVAQLALLAGDAKTLPVDGRTIGWIRGEPIGKIELSLRTPDFEMESVDTGNRTTGLFRSLLPSRSNSSGSLLMALGLPREYLATLATFSADDPISAVYAVLPDEIGNYAITAPGDKYGRRQLSVRVELEVKAVTKIAMPGGTTPILVLSVEPVEAGFTERNDTSAVIERFDIRRDVAPPSYELIDMPPRYALVRAIGTAYGLDARGIMEYKMSHPKGLSAFEIQKRVESVFEASEASASEGAVDYWIVGTIRVNDYDFATNTFKFYAGDYGIRLPEMMRDPDLTTDAINTAFIDQEYLKIAIAPEEAEEFAKRLNLPGDLPIRVLVRPRQAEQSTYGRLRVSSAAVYGEILDKMAVPTIDDPSRVVFRFGARPDGAASLGAEANPSRTRDAAIAFLLESVDENERFVMIQRSGTKKVSVVLTHNVQTRDYLSVVRNEALDMPGASEAFIYGFPVKIAEKFRNDPNAALLFSPRRVMDETSPGGTAPDQLREVLISLAQEFDLEIAPFPPKPKAIINTGRTSIEDLLAGDPRFVVIRRRDDTGPISSAYTALSDRNFYDAGLMEVAMINYARADMEKLGYVFQSDLPAQSSKIDLREIPDKLRAESNAAVILSPESLAKIFNRISDLDLVGRRFPLEKVDTGIPRDHKQTAEQYSVLGVSGGMGRAAAISSLATEFDLNEFGDTQANVIFAGGEACPEAVLPEAGKAEEAGLRCVRVEFDGNWVKSVSLRQVIAGDVEEAVLEALLKRFGRSPFMKETRYLEAGATRITQGWGDLVAGERAALGRVDAKFLPTVIEAVIWVQEGMTSVYVRLDKVQTVSERQAAETPKIKF